MEAPTGQPQKAPTEDVITFGLSSEPKKRAWLRCKIGAALEKQIMQGLPLGKTDVFYAVLTEDLIEKQKEIFKQNQKIPEMFESETAVANTFWATSAEEDAVTVSSRDVYGMLFCSGKVLSTDYLMRCLLILNVIPRTGWMPVLLSSKDEEARSFFFSRMMKPDALVAYLSSQDKDIKNFGTFLSYCLRAVVSKKNIVLKRGLIGRKQKDVCE
jgi:hypothetical protein